MLSGEWWVKEYVTSSIRVRRPPRLRVGWCVGAFWHSWNGVKGRFVRRKWGEGRERKMDGMGHGEHGGYLIGLGWIR
jgi:hypothetical protein